MEDDPRGEEGAPGRQIEPPVDFETMMIQAGLHLDQAQAEALRGGYRHMQIMLRRTLDAQLFQTADTNVLNRLHRPDPDRK